MPSWLYTKLSQNFCQIVFTILYSKCTLYTFTANHVSHKIMYAIWYTSGLQFIVLSIRIISVEEDIKHKLIAFGIER